MYNGEDIRKAQEERRENILKGFGVEVLMEKAHVQGDVHPNGKWYWETSAAGGKGDWRTIGGRGSKKSSGQVAKNDKIEEKEEDNAKIAVVREYDLENEDGTPLTRKSLSGKEVTLKGFEVSTNISNKKIVGYLEQRWGSNNRSVVTIGEYEVYIDDYKNNLPISSKNILKTLESAKNFFLSNAENFVKEMEAKKKLKRKK